jgi:hypothetical protein
MSPSRPRWRIKEKSNISVSATMENEGKTRYLCFGHYGRRWVLLERKEIPSPRCIDGHS